MSDPDRPDFLLFLILVVLSAIFSGTETALASLNKGAIHKISEQGRLRSRFMSLWAEQPERVTTTLIFCNLAAIVVASILASEIAFGLTEGAGKSRGWTIAITAGIVTLTLLLIGAVAPKTFARWKAESVVSKVAVPVFILSWLISPISCAASKIAFGIIRTLGKTEPVSLPPTVTDEEVRALVETGVEEGGIEQEKQELIHGIFEFAEATVREVMVPRVDMVCVEASTPMEEILEVFAEKKFSRMPVYDEVVDNVVGIIHIKNILNFWRKKITKMTAMEFVAHPYFVPKTKKIIELLEEFRQQHLHIAIVVDEYGGTAGLVTMEDMIEEIVGEIEDEHVRATQPIKKTHDGSYLIDARVEIDHLNETLSLDLPKGEFETVGGLLYQQFGKIPVRGEEMELNGLRITVLEGDVKRIRRVKLAVVKQENLENLPQK